jgi:hypothetical protein
VCTNGKPTGKAKTNKVVVSRPYLLSFYARERKRGAWVVTAAYVSSCGKNNSVTRTGPGRRDHHLRCAWL